MTLQVGDVQAAKRAKLLELLQRVARYRTAEEAADAILPDWHPMCRIDGQGRVEILVGDANKRLTSETQDG